jgi:hypothetical protein
MVLALYQRDGMEWLKVIDRFAEIEYQATFACCIDLNDPQLLKCLLGQLQ